MKYLGETRILETKSGVITEEKVSYKHKTQNGYQNRTKWVRIGYTSYTLNYEGNRVYSGSYGNMLRNHINKKMEEGVSSI